MSANIIDSLPEYAPRTPQLPSSPPASHPRFLPENSNFDGEDALLHLSPQPSPDAELPPAYSAYDENITSFTLDPPYIYATTTTHVPRYHLLAEFTRSGKPDRLCIRRLLATESRRLSMSSIKGKKMPRIDYDEDITLYVVQHEHIRGRQKCTLLGHIKLERGMGKCKFWHMTRNEAGDSLKKENERKIQKYGYHARDEWHKNLLFAVQKCEWRDGTGSVVARETRDRFKIERVLSISERDTLITCWAAKRWYANHKEFKEAEGMK